MRHGQHRPAPRRGAATFPEPGDVARMAGSGRAVTIAERVDHDSMAVIYRAVTPEGPLAVRWYLRESDAGDQRRLVASLAADGSPHPAFAWPLGIVECAGVRGLGYATRWIPERFVRFLGVVSADEQPPLRTMAWIGGELAAAFAALHARGLRFRAVDFGSVLADPAAGDVVVMFDDKIGPEGEDAYIYGTVSLMAPEQARGAARQSAATDLHSLAVLLFYLLMHGHPLEGRRGRYDDYDPDHGDAEPLFVFDPADHSNAPPPGDPVLGWWPVYPRFIRDLFTRAFTTGLTDAPPGGRVAARDWQQAMARLADSCSACSCDAQVIWDPGQPQARCWHCGLVPPVPALLELPGHRIVLAEGAVLTSGHLPGGDGRALLGVAHRHPAVPGQVVLRNVSDVAWVAEPAGEEPKTVLPGQAIRVRPMTISFAGMRASITTASET